MDKKEMLAIAKKVEGYLLGLGLTIWEKGDHKRIYINDLKVVGLLEVETVNPKAFRRESMYFDCKTGGFRYDVSRSAESTMDAIIALIREKATAETKEEIIMEERTTETIISPFSRNKGEEFKEKNKVYKVVKCIKDPDYDDIFILQVELISEEESETKEIKEQANTDTKKELERNMAIIDLVDEIIENDAIINENYLMQGDFVYKVGDYPSPNHLTIKKDKDFIYIVNVENEISTAYKAPVHYMKKIEDILKN